MTKKELSKLNFLFSHRNYPAQFRHILIELAKNPQNNIFFLTGTENNNYIKGVKKIVYKLKRKVPENSHRYLKQYEEAIIHGQACAEAAIQLKNSGFTPDIIYSHGWGNSMFFKDIFPNVPLINYCEWYHSAEGSDVDFDGFKPDYDKKAMIRCNNSQFLQDLTSCDIGICPTEWQKSRFPKIFHNKIKVIHDGIDTEYFKPDCNAVFKIPNSNTNTDTNYNQNHNSILTKNDEVLTYATRGMEAYRGFPQFMEAAEILLQKRPNLQIVIAGQDRICYGPKPIGGSYKKIMLKKLNLDMQRVHFTGALPYNEYLKLLQVSSVHFYFTYPFVLSWSMLEAMSTGCLIVGSKTQPVEEVIKDGKNGLLVDFFDKKVLIEKINYALDNKETLQDIRKNARKTIVEKYDIKKLLPRQIEVMKKLV